MVDRPDWDLRLGYLIHDVSRLRRMMFDRALAPLVPALSAWRSQNRLQLTGFLPNSGLRTLL